MRQDGLLGFREQVGRASDGPAEISSRKKIDSYGAYSWLQDFVQISCNCKLRPQTDLSSVWMLA